MARGETLNVDARVRAARARGGAVAHLAHSPGGNVAKHDRRVFPMRRVGEGNGFGVPPPFFLSDLKGSWRGQ